MLASNKAAPVPTPETQEYWQGCANNELRIQRCNQCAHFYFYPRAACPQCASTDIAWVVASGRGTLHTYLINHLRSKGFEEETPFAIAVVQLEEGPRMMANIIGVPNTPEHLILDMPLQVSFAPRGELMVPVFGPVEDAA